MVLATPFWFCVLPLFILSAPMRLMWAKAQHRTTWRWVSAGWLVVSILCGLWATFGIEYEKDGRRYAGIPIGVPDSLEFLAALEAGSLAGLNLSFVSGTLMLPLTFASYVEAKRPISRTTAGPHSA